MKKSELKQLIKEQINSLREDKNIKKINNFIYKTSQTPPKKDDWVLKFKQINQYDFKSGELKPKDYKYFPVKVPLESFLFPEDLKIIATNDPKLIKDGVPPINIKEGLKQLNRSQVKYNGRTYYVEYEHGDKKIFAYLDKDLQKLAKINGKTLMFNSEDIKDYLIK